MKNLNENLPHCLSEIIPPHIPVQQLSYRSGSFIFKENQHVKGVYYICFGNVQLYRNDKNGVTQKLAIVGIDEWMGISTALFEKHYTNSAKALTDVKICFIKLDDFDKMLPENPVLAKKLLHNLTSRLNKLDHMHLV